MIKLILSEEFRSTPSVSLATCGSTSGVHQQLTTNHGKWKSKKQLESRDGLGFVGFFDKFLHFREILWQLIMIPLGTFNQ